MQHMYKTYSYRIQTEDARSALELIWGVEYVARLGPAPELPGFPVVQATDALLKQVLYCGTQIGRGDILHSSILHSCILLTLLGCLLCNQDRLESVLI